jgi:hypothetical protein
VLFAAVTVPGVASASSAPVRTFKVVITPSYATAGAATTFAVSVSNTSSQPTSIGSVALKPPTGFTISTSSLSASLRRKALVKQGILSLHRLAVRRGTTLRFAVTATAPSKCGKSAVRWTVNAFQGGQLSGQQLALQSLASSVGVTVVCPMLAPCGDGGPACSTTQTTSVSSYTAISNAGSGTLLGALDVGRRLTCNGYTSQDPNWYESIVTGIKTTVAYRIQYKLKNSTPTLVRACAGLAFEFKTASGAAAPRGALPNGTPGFIGVLPRCAAATTGPCVVSITSSRDQESTTGVDVRLTARIPAQSPGDPWLGP